MSVPSIFIRFPPNWRRKQAAIQSHQWDTSANLNPTGVLTYLALKCTQRNDNRMMVFSFGCLLHCTGPTFRFAGLHPEFEAPFCASKPDGSDLEVSGIVHVLWVNFRDSVPDATVKKWVNVLTVISISTAIRGQMQTLCFTGKVCNTCTGNDRNLEASFCEG